MIDIKTLRRKNNLTQEDLAELSNISVRTIQKYEQGELNTLNITLKNALSLCEALNIDLYTFLGI